MRRRYAECVGPDDLLDIVRACGRVLFARHGLPGETVRVRMTESSRSFVRGEVLQVLAPSSQRVLPACPHAGAFQCGGCDLQHATEEAQLAWKAAVATEHLRRLAGIDNDLLVEPAGVAPAGSRVRLRCRAGNDGRLGLRRHGSHELEPLSVCLLADPRLAPAFNHRWTVGTEVELRAVGAGPARAILTDDAGAVRVTDLDGHSVADDPSEVRVRNRMFSVSSSSFWQSHRAAPEFLTSSVVEGLDISSVRHVVDLYGGVGLFGLTLTDEMGARASLTLVERSPSAVVDARRNGADLGDVEVYESSVTARVVSELVNHGDVVVLDPPRRGAGQAVAHALASARPSAIAYVSCDAATLSRDLRVLLDDGCRLRHLRAVDLFPWTEHLELVAILDGPA
jgi:tRNA/tmRNA/rRNA uracil-C5-methylase (TrmA/RlmC/RlmD family)